MSLGAAWGDVAGTKLLMSTVFVELCATLQAIATATNMNKKPFINNDISISQYTPTQLFST